MTVDLAAVIRRSKADKRHVQLTTRPLETLMSAASFSGDSRPLILLDTNVYMMEFASRLPPSAARLVNEGLLFHCSVCLSELAAGVGNAYPGHTNWKTLRNYYGKVIADIPTSRLLTPDEDVWVEAGIISGALARTQNYQRHQRKECLNDALIYLTAAKAGLPVLTANRDEFDFIQQLAGRGRFIHF